MSRPDLIALVYSRWYLRSDGGLVMVPAACIRVSRSYPSGFTSSVHSGNTSSNLKIRRGSPLSIRSLIVDLFRIAFKTSRLLTGISPNLSHHSRMIPSSTWSDIRNFNLPRLFRTMFARASGAFRLISCCRSGLLKKNVRMILAIHPKSGEYGPPAL